jgi:hypothetical protein
VSERKIQYDQDVVVDRAIHAVVADSRHPTPPRLVGGDQSGRGSVRCRQ